MERFRRIIVMATIVSLLMSTNAITFVNATSRNTQKLVMEAIQKEGPLLQKNEITIAEGSTVNLSQEENVNVIKQLRQGTIIYYLYINK